MRFREIKFQHSEAQTIYDRYMKNVRKAINRFPKEERAEIIMELNSHIYEAMQRIKRYDEVQIISDIIDHLGDPQESWASVEVDKAYADKDHTTTNLKWALEEFKIGTLYTLSYMLLVISAILISCKVHFGEIFGLYYKKGEYFALGSINDGLHSLEYERLGMWYIPIWMVCFTLACYLIKELKKDEEDLEIKRLLIT